MNQPPEAPTIDGPTRGRPGVEYNYTFVTTDPEGDQVYYLVIWEEEQRSDWLGPYDSNEVITEYHLWAEPETYTIMARAKDDFDAIGDWTILEITIPRNRVNYASMFLWLLVRFPLLEILLNLLR